MIQDSGNRREFDTGAVRDIAEGKGRCDLLPLDVVSEITISFPYDRAFLWNMLGLLWTLRHKPEMNDLPFKEDGK